MAKDVDPLSVYFTPLIKHLDVIRTRSFREVLDGELLRKTDHPATEAVHFLMHYPDTRNARAFRLWLDLNLSPKIGERICSMTLGISSELRHVFVRTQEGETSPNRSSWKMRKSFRCPDSTAKKSGGTYSRDSAVELQSYLQAIAACDRKTRSCRTTCND